MLRCSSNRLQLGLAILVLVCLFTASLGGVQAGGRTQGFAPTQNHSDAPALAKQTKTPTPSKTRKPKKTKTPTAAPTETVAAAETPSSIPLTATATETPSESATPTETLAASATATSTETNTATAEPSPTRKRRKTRTPTAEPTKVPVGKCGSVSTRRAIAEIDAQRGGELVSPDCRIRVLFPPNLLRRNTFVRYDEGGSNPGQQEVVGAFQLRVLNVKGKPRRHAEFDAPMTIQAYYDPDALGALEEGILDLAYWNEQADAWIPLNGTLDQEKNIITAQTDHFSQFALLSASDLKPYIPGVQEFQTDLFTGAATVNYPLVVPQGRGGLTPKLDLNYSSALANSFDSQTQAGLVGVGWSLDTGYIARNVHHYSSGNVTYFLHSFTLVLNGVSYELVPGSDGHYHTASESYMRIDKNTTNNNPGSWTVIGKDGTTYVFGGDNAHRTRWYRRDPDPSHPTIQPVENYLWTLKTATDRHGNQIKYYYGKDTILANSGDPGRCTSGDFDTAIYLNTIQYNFDGSGNPLSQIIFSYLARTDKVNYFTTTQCGRAPYLQKKLDRVEAQTVVQGGGGLQTIRKYNFTTSNGAVFAGIPYSTTVTTTDSSGALGLTRVWQESPWNSNVQLDLGSFDYLNSRVKSATNALGGNVQYAYTESNISSDSYHYVYKIDFNQQANLAMWGGADNGSPVFQESNAAKSLVSSCVNGGNVLHLSAAAQGSDAWIGHTIYPFAPTGHYQVFVQLEGVDSGSASGSVSIGTQRFSLGSEINLSFTANFSGCGSQASAQLDFQLPDTASMMQVRVHTTSRIRIRKVEIRKLDMYLRYVDSKRVRDNLGSDALYAYISSNGAVNDAAHSDIINYRTSIGDCPGACGDLRHQPFTEFRGFGTVRVQEPNESGGAVRQSVYTFYQDDVKRGQVATISEESGAGVKYRVTTNVINSVNTVARNNSTGDRSDFVYVGETTAQTFDGDNNAANAKQQRNVFLYDPYGNLKEKQEYDSGNALYRKTTIGYAKKVDDAAFPGVYVVNLTDKTRVYDAAGTQMSLTDNTWDANWKGELISVKVRDGTSTYTKATYGYDAYGNRTSAQDANGTPTTTTYDTLYNTFPYQVTTPLGTTTMTYDYRFGLPQNITDPNNATARIEYDDLGRKLNLYNPIDFGSGNPTQKITYNLSSTGTSKVKIETRSDAGGASAAVYSPQWVFVDGLGRVIQTQKRAATTNTIIVVDQEYLLRGLLNRATNPYFASGNGGTFVAQTFAQPLSKYNYDALGRTTKVIYPDNTNVQTVYDHWTTFVTNQNGAQTEYRGDAFGRTVKVFEYLNGTPYETKYVYDVMDRLTQVLDSGTPRNATTMTYDWLGRKTTMTDPDMGAWSYRYDKNDNLIEQTDAKGQRACFYYDALNRLKGKNYQTNVSACPTSAGSYAVSYLYDQGTNVLGQTQKGFRTSMSDASGSTSWQFDMLGRVLKESKSINGAPANPYVTEYSYNTLGQALTLKYPDNEVVATSYNAQNLPQDLNGYITSASYNASDQLTTFAFASGTTTTYTYNPNNLRLTSLVTSGNIQNFGYTYDNVGNVKAITDGVNNQVSTFTYDDLNRLLSASIPGVYAQSWTYNSIGNILTRTDNGTPTNYSYGDANHDHAVTAMGANAYAYDANGNMINRAGDALTYDAENRLTSITVGGTTTTYSYDGDGNRVKKVAGSTTTYYVGNHYEVTNGVATKYYYFGKQRIALRNNVGVVYLHSDHLGSTSATSGATSSAQTYYPFGSIRTATGSVPTDFGFTGQRRDASAGLMYYNARYYDPTLGRFTQADKIALGAREPQNLNRYAYVRNNPLKYIDPSGYCVDTAYSSRGCPSWMSDSVFGLLELAADLTVLNTAYAPSEDGHLNDLTTLEARVDERWYQGVLVSLYDPADYAQTFDACTSGDCDAWRVGGAALPLVSGNLVSKAAKRAKDPLGKALQEQLERLNEQIHHIASDKNPQWTPVFQDLARKYKLDLDDAWNKILIPHKRGWSGGGGHPQQYHQWVLEQIQSIDRIAKGNQEKFLELFNERVRGFVEQHPEILIEEWWQ